MSHHSALKREYGDSVIIGASSLKHIKENLEDLEKGPLRESYAAEVMIWHWYIIFFRQAEEVVKVLDQAWEIVKSCATQYYYWFRPGIGNEVAAVTSYLYV